MEAIQKAAEATTAPKETDFTDFADYEAARSLYQTEIALDKRDERRFSEEVDVKKAEIDGLNQQAQAEAQQNWAAQSDDARSRYTDFDQVVSAPDLRITDSMSAAIVASDAGADVAYYLGTNKQEAQRIAGLKVTRCRR